MPGMREGGGAVKERPILFSAPMVRAILAGTKTQTRRVAKTEITMGRESISGPRHGGYSRVYFLGNKHDLRDIENACPYGQPGDRLWVRETFQRFSDDGEVMYKADPASFQAMNEMKRDECTEARWRPAIHMPRAASRITLEVTGVRVERLQDISEDDAIAEGIGQVVQERLPKFEVRGEYDAIDIEPVDEYRDLWESINGAGSWDANPWVWVVEFKRVTP